MTLDKLDELVASFARPYSIYICSTSIALSLPMAIYLKAGDLVVGAIAATVGGIVTGTAYFRTIDKKTAAMNQSPSPDTVQVK